MKKIIALLIGVFFMAISGCAPNVDINVEETKVKVVLDQLIKSSETKDMELTSKIYAHDSDMIIIGTDGGEYIVGWNALKDLLEKQFAGTESSKLSVKNQVIKVHDSGMVAWFSELIDWDITFEGKTDKMEGLRTTGVLEKRNGNWVIVQLHYSVPNQ
ncbi:MAG: nuclear transport factor 2 family protein [Melioribacteraceae bacterium]|jgi:ketosteroid isomerase-like protein|nr:nuclear transport factor 2 family protein [Melioribacteraceae bacterium]